jgi:excinuclease ABC subunit A
VLHRLRDHGNTVVIIEHNLDVIRTADWVIDLGPEGGDGGGTILCEGTPQAIAEHPQSYTGKYLAQMLGVERDRKVAVVNAAAATAKSTKAAKPAKA